ncbi:GNAT family N-acetyltransferase [Sphingobacterium sp. MYb382]|uniref:GNAT family N-acetyltransferase n=1 Tax=Sphingobacterium sp. MYb382 TaxID=2745278 RepID=UPI0030B4CFEA
MDKKVSINGSSYTLRIGYQADLAGRKELNRMSNQFWGFDFENFYQSGYWDDSCVLYSLFDEGRMLAHTTLSKIDATVEGEVLHLGQIGTVMTDEEHQKKGLSRFLMEYIQKDQKDKLDGFFLFANDSVLDFYPKFGFVAIDEHQAFCPVSPQDKRPSTMKMNLDDREQCMLFESYVLGARPTSSLYMHNYALTFFYCFAYPDFGFKDAVYYLPELSSIAVAQIEGDTLTIFEVFEMEPTPMEAIIQALWQEGVTKVVFGFSPEGIAVDKELYKEEDITLFVSQNIRDAIDGKGLMVPLLSHT